MKRFPIEKYPLTFSPTSQPSFEAWSAWEGRSPSWPELWRSSGITARFYAGVRALSISSGVNWAITSTFRDSPSHAHGGAVDLAPIIVDWAKYALARGADPLLNGRLAVQEHVQAAAAAASSQPAASHRIIWCIEDDHVHAHVVAESGPDTVWRVQWRTHQSYQSFPADAQCRIDPSKFKPRFHV